MKTKRFFITAAVFVTLSLIMVPCSNSTSLGSNNTLNTGFRGIKWFTKKSQISGLYKPTNFDFGQYIFFRKNENNSLGDIPLTAIQYHFNENEEFDYVTISFEKAHFERIIEYFTNILGRYSSTNLNVVWDLPLIKVTIWNGGPVVIFPKKEKGATNSGL